MGYRIEIAVDDCMSSGKCIGDFPDSFAFDADELASLRTGGPIMSDQDMIKAARNCPSQALQVYDQAGNQVAT